MKPYVLSGRRCLAVEGACEFEEPARLADLPDLPGAVAAALDAPLGAPPLAELAVDARAVAVVVPDATRDCPVATLLPPVLERLARAGDPYAFNFPSGRGEDFSFAGLKTALLYRTRDLDMGDAQVRADLAASYQRAIVDALVRRAERALERAGLSRLALGGGVAANGPLRERLAALGAELFLPALALCTDNAAMIAAAALDAPALAYPDYLSLDVYATGEGPLR